MAFIRAFGGGGIPSALKSAMNAVLNKKFGTSTTYAPEDWPEDVNLLGPLPEKTVSGAIAHIEDGADTVPLKSLDVTVDANLDGVSSIEVTQAGKNLYGKVPFLATTSNTPTFAECTYIKAGQYTLSFGEISDFNANVATSWRYCITIYDTSGNIVTNASPASQLAYRSTLYSYTNGSNSSAKSIILNFASDCYIFIRFWSGTTTADMTMKECQLEIGGTQTTYIEYSGTVTTVSLGRTIYGGSADVVNGTGTDGFSNPISLNSLTWYPTTIGGNVCFYADLPSGYMGTGSAAFEGVCSSYSVTNDGNMGTDQTIRFYYNANYNFSRVSIRDDQYASLTGAQFKAAVTGNIVYKLAEASQTDFTFTPISPTPQTPLGTSNFWADTGDSEVTYRADIALALAANSSRGLMMASRSVTQLIGEESDLNQVNELVEGDENGRDVTRRINH